MSEAVNAAEKRRDYLSESEIASLFAAARKGRHGVRDLALVMLLFHHGLRVTEATRLTLSDVIMGDATLNVRRLKGGLSTTQPLAAPVFRALKAYLRQRQQAGTDHLPWLFLSERGEPFARQGINYLIKTIGARARLPIPLHPHMLRHSCGYALANRAYDLRLIQDYLGHRNPKHTVRYTRTAAKRFRGLWT
jgi:type 1 fimbriae regulatory protein FimB